MSEVNRYRPPTAPVRDVAQSDAESLEALNRIARGQRQVMFALLAQMGAAASATALPGYGLILVIAAFVYGVVSLVQLSSALGISVVSRVLLCIGLLIPIMSLLILATLSARASRRLRAGGFHIGFLGAKPRDS